MACSRTQIEFDPLGADGDSGLGGLSGGAGLSGSGGVGGADGGGAGSGGVITGGASGATAAAQATNDCQLCTCDSCRRVGRVRAMPGCRAILDYADQNGCSGADCYLGPCNEVIDQNGGPSVTQRTARDVRQCRDRQAARCGGTRRHRRSWRHRRVEARAGAVRWQRRRSAHVLQLRHANCPEVTQCCSTRPAATAFYASKVPRWRLRCRTFGVSWAASAATSRPGEAFQALQCFFSQCSTACQGAIPGLPGFGGAPAPINAEGSLRRGQALRRGA
jgi:hypothetical protein